MQASRASWRRLWVFPIPAEMIRKAKEGAGTHPRMACAHCRMSSRKITHFSCHQVHVPGTELYGHHPRPPSPPFPSNEGSKKKKSGQTDNRSAIPRSQDLSRRGEEEIE